MTRRWLLLVVFCLGATVLAVGCSENEESNPLVVALEKEIMILPRSDTEAGSGGASAVAAPAGAGGAEAGSAGAAERFSGKCFAPCKGSSLPDPALSNRCPEDTLEQECGFVAGQEQVRVSVQYNVDVTSPTVPADPTVKQIADGVVTTLTSTVDWTRANEHDGTYRPVASLLLRAPNKAVESLAFRVTAADNVTADSAAFDVAPAPLRLSALDCGGASHCDVPSGSTMHVAMHAPVGFVGQTVTFESQLDGVPVPTSSPITKTLLAIGEEAVVNASVPLGSGVGKGWQVTATLAAGAQAFCDGQLLERGTPRLSVFASGANIDISSTGVPARVMGEPSVDCRTYEVKIEVPNPPDSRSATLTASDGDVAGAGEKSAVVLEADGTAHTQWTLPEAPPELVKLTLDAEGSRSVQRRVALQKVLPRDGLGHLSTLSPHVVIDQNGVPSGVHLNGALRSVTGAKFSPNSKVIIRATATPAPASPLPCGKPVAASALTCDPLADQPADRGGCFLTDFTADVAADGSYSVTLAGGLCFAGEVSITALSMVYTEDPRPGQCLGELKTSAVPANVGSASVSFDAPESAGDGGSSN